MKILFTSDLHGSLYYKSFAHILREGDFDCGCIGGDNQRDVIPNNEVQKLLGFTDDHMIPMLLDYDDPQQIQQEIDRTFKLQRQALTIEAANITHLLSQNKPIFITTGNHDKAIWDDYKNVYILENGRKINFNGYNFIGYQKTNIETNPDEIKKDLKRIERQINKRTILLTHAPPYGILDRGNENRHIGDETLRSVIENKKPAFHLFGHSHVSSGYQNNFVNGSFLEKKVFYSINVEENTVEEINVVKV